MFAWRPHTTMNRTCFDRNVKKKKKKTMYTFKKNTKTFDKLIGWQAKEKLQKNWVPLLAFSVSLSTRSIYSQCQTHMCIFSKAMDGKRKKPWSLKADDQSIFFRLFCKIYFGSFFIPSSFFVIFFSKRKEIKKKKFFLNAKTVWIFSLWILPSSYFEILR